MVPASGCGSPLPSDQAGQASYCTAGAGLASCAQLCSVHLLASWEAVTMHSGIGAYGNNKQLTNLALL